MGSVSGGMRRERRSEEKETTESESRRGEEGRTDVESWSMG